MTNSPDRSLHRHIWVSREQWERSERTTEGSPHSPKQVPVEFAMEALNRREWPGTETEMRVARASLFAAQAIARRLIADGRESEVQEIREFISTFVPDSDAPHTARILTPHRTGRARRLADLTPTSMCPLRPCRQ